MLKGVTFTKHFLPGILLFREVLNLANSFIFLNYLVFVGIYYEYGMVYIINMFNFQVQEFFRVPVKIRYFSPDFLSWSNLESKTFTSLITKSLSV